MFQWTILTLVCLLCSAGRFFQKQPGTTELMGVERFSDMVLEYKFSKNVFCKFYQSIVTPSMKPVFLVFFGRVGHVLQKQADTTQNKQEEWFSGMVLECKYSKIVFCKFVQKIVTPSMKLGLLVFYNSELMRWINERNSCLQSLTVSSVPVSSGGKSSQFGISGKLLKPSRSRDTAWAVSGWFRSIWFICPETLYFTR